MTEFGYALSSEEHGPTTLVRNAVKAEQEGYSFAVISDHYHPWIDRQGESPFVWSVLGGIAGATERLRVGTGVTCPMIRIHPAVIAQAVATTETMMPGRFFLGVGTGENLNEHILGDHWPEAPVRLEMLEEAVEVIRRLLDGGMVSHRGRHYTVENARIYTRPDTPPPIMFAAAGSKAMELAAQAGDGLIATSPDAVETFTEAGGKGKPTYGKVTVCWAESEEKARRIAHEWWPNTALKGVGSDLPTPAHFGEAAEMVTEDDVAAKVPCGPDPERHLEVIRKFVDAGFSHVYFHQVGPDQAGFFDFYDREILPALRT